MARLIEELKKLPGVGTKTSDRKPAFGLTRIGGSDGGFMPKNAPYIGSATVGKPGVVSR